MSGDDNGQSHAGEDLTARNTASGSSAYPRSITARTACLNGARPASSKSMLRRR
jgi:hypothetical protein